MGGSGAFLKSGGFSKWEWEKVGAIDGIKIIRKIGINQKDKGDLPFYSNTPGTAYVLLDAKGKFSQFRQYNESRKSQMDIDYGIHGGKLSLHMHIFGDGGRSRNPVIIAYPGGDIINKDLYEKYKGFLKGIKL